MHQTEQSPGEEAGSSPGSRTGEGQHTCWGKQKHTQSESTPGVTASNLNHREAQIAVHLALDLRGEMDDRKEASKNIP